MFIRYLADTTESPQGLAALAYMRGFMRLAPVRLVTLTGVLEGRWDGYAQLLGTPMVGTMVNAVCADPSRWTWVQRVAASSQNITAADDAQSLAEKLATPGRETITGRMGLCTVGVRNVLFAVTDPRLTAEYEEASRFDVVVVPAPRSGDGAISYRQIVVIPIDSALKATSVLQEVLFPPAQ